MLFEEITHSNDIVQDIRNIFSNEIHTLVFLSQEAFEELRKTKSIYETNTHLDYCYHYKEDRVICLEKNQTARLLFLIKQLI